MVARQDRSDKNHFDKSSPGQNWTDQKVENIIGSLLRAGVLLSALVVSDWRHHLSRAAWSLAR